MTFCYTRRPLQHPLSPSSQYLLPSLGAIPTGLEVGGLELPSVSSQELVEPSEAEVVDHALVTFTTGSTGMPKLMMRKHR